jgi:hypothetical protein
MVQRRHLVVIIPGIGGSVLRRPDGEVVWRAGFGDLLSLPRRAERLSLAETLVPTGLTHREYDRA